MKKKVLLLTTGGTIASRETENGLAPKLSSDELLLYADGLRSFYDVETKDLLNLDSSNISPDEWIAIAHAIYEALPRYDGIVVTHGTDTMAYTASMISFMLMGLNKPVVFTGSQMPIDHPLTDARNNLFTAFEAVSHAISGVSIAFNRKIIQGCRAVKVRTMGFEAFESVNAGYLGEVFADGLHATVRPKREREETRLMDRICRQVFLLKLIPGMDAGVLRMLRDMHCRGIVIEAFGAGGMQFVGSSLLEGLRQLANSGISVVVCSQCLYEASNLELYEVGRKLLDSGVISARDMTTEATVTKLMWALGQSQSPDAVRKSFETNYCGEITL